MYIDTHCHLDLPDFENDREIIIEKARKEKILIINVGINLESSIKSIELAHKYKNIFTTVGIHPNEVKNISLSDINQLKKLAKNEKVVGIGETGIDYHYSKDFSDKQKDFFSAQIEIAGELNLPLIIHQRESKLDILEILGKNKIPKKIVFHCFGGDKQLAEYCLKKGIFISFTGTVTFPNAKNVMEVAKNFPIEKILVETDSPFLSPEPFRGKRNDPTKVRYIAEKIIELKGEEISQCIEKFYQTTIKFFNLNI